ncbi:hypothetical protein [Streptomyces sp. enrichment culture]|uniref:hypothetical protein n=1 Tax=Streptomyces sp. enrichment culture TaxID=1795815 RepID=UPI003F568EC3
MTASQLDTVINAYMWIDAQLATYGPGLILAVGVRLVWRGTWRTLDRLAAARETVTHSQTHGPRDTQPGTNQDALHTCTAIWNTSTRKEK